MTESTVLHVRIDKEVKARLEEVAKEDGRTVGAYVRLMLSRHVKGRHRLNRLAPAQQREAGGGLTGAPGQ